MLLFVLNLYLFVTEALDIIFIHPKFNDKYKERTMFKQLIEVFKLSKHQITH